MHGAESNHKENFTFAGNLKGDSERWLRHDPAAERHGLWWHAKVHTLCGDELSVLTECQHPEGRELDGWSLQCRAPGMIPASPDNGFISAADYFNPLLGTCYLSSLMLWILLACLSALTWLLLVLQSLTILPNSGFPVIWLIALPSCILFPKGSSTPVLYPFILSCFAYLMLWKSFIIFCLTLSYFISLFSFLPCHLHLVIGSLCMRKTRLKMSHSLSLQALRKRKSCKILHTLFHWYYKIWNS